MGKRAQLRAGLMKEVRRGEHCTDIVIGDALSQALHDLGNVIHIQAKLADTRVAIADGKQVAQFGVFLDQLEEAVGTDRADRFEQRVANGAVQDAVEIFLKGVAQDKWRGAMAAARGSAASVNETVRLDDWLEDRSAAPRPRHISKGKVILGESRRVPKPHHVYLLIWDLDVDQFFFNSRIRTKGWHDTTHIGGDAVLLAQAEEQLDDLLRRPLFMIVVPTDEKGVETSVFETL